MSMCWYIVHVIDKENLWSIIFIWKIHTQMKHPEILQTPKDNGIGAFWVKRL